MIMERRIRHRCRCAPLIERYSDSAVYWKARAACRRRSRPRRKGITRSLTLQKIPQRGIEFAGAIHVGNVPGAGQRDKVRTGQSVMKLGHRRRGGAVLLADDK